MGNTGIFAGIWYAFGTLGRWDNDIDSGFAVSPIASAPMNRIEDES
jgi:hypothetical protein